MMKKIWIVVLLFAVLLLSAGSWFLFSTQGNRIIVRAILLQYSKGEDISLGVSEGNFLKGITFRDLELTNLRDFPRCSRLKVQSLSLAVRSLNIIKGLVIEVQNARLLLPESEPILVFGSFVHERFNFNIYSRGFSIGEVSGYFPAATKFPVSGDFGDIDLYVKGSYEEPELEGSFLVEKIIHEKISLQDAPGGDKFAF